jgi:hypothetical protein
LQSNFSKTSSPKNSFADNKEAFLANEEEPMLLLSHIHNPYAIVEAKFFPLLWDQATLYIHGMFCNNSTIIEHALYCNKGFPGFHDIVQEDPDAPTAHRHRDRIPPKVVSSLRSL